MVRTQRNDVQGIEESPGSITFPPLHIVAGPNDDATPAERLILWAMREPFPEEAARTSITVVVPAGLPQDYALLYLDRIRSRLADATIWEMLQADPEHTSDDLAQRSEERWAIEQRDDETDTWSEERIDRALLRIKQAAGIAFLRMPASARHSHLGRIAGIDRVTARDIEDAIVFADSVVADLNRAAAEKGGRL